jgi:Protein of unknown function (DUF1634)
MESHTAKSATSAVASTLLAGVVASCALLVAGLLWYGLRPSPIRQLDIHALRQPWVLDSTMFLHVGLLVLMLTPFARVVVLLVEFVREREFSFAFISFVVLLLLSLGVTIGLA